LNEPEFEHKTTPELYTIRYDAMVQAIHKVSPQTNLWVSRSLSLPTIRTGLNTFSIITTTKRAFDRLHLVPFLRHATA